MKRVAAWCVVVLLAGAWIAIPFVAVGLVDGFIVWGIVLAVGAGCFAFAWALNEIRWGS